MTVDLQNAGLTSKVLYENTKSLPVYLSSNESFYAVTVTEAIESSRHGSVKVKSNEALSDLLGKEVGYNESDTAVIVTVCVCALGLTGASSLS